MTVSDSDEEAGLAIFEEPPSFRQPTPPPTSTTYTLLSGSPTLHLNLVGSSPLWGHMLWYTSIKVAEYLQRNPFLVRGKAVLELGAGGGLPSLVSATLGAKRVCVTDYPEAALVANLEENVSQNRRNWDDETNVVVEGFLWGSQPGSKLRLMLDASGGSFDLLILSDLLFNHSEHEKLVASVKSFLRRAASGISENDHPRALVFFTPHRPALYEKDLAFFELARREGLLVEKLFTEVVDKPMFAVDRGDEKMRRTIEAWELRW